MSNQELRLVPPVRADGDHDAAIVDDDTAAMLLQAIQTVEERMVASIEVHLPPNVHAMLKL
jgi:hypothetical protein